MPQITLRDYAAIQDYKVGTIDGEQIACALPSPDYPDYFDVQFTSATGACWYLLIGDRTVEYTPRVSADERALIARVLGHMRYSPLSIAHCISCEHYERGYTGLYERYQEVIKRAQGYRESGFKLLMATEKILAELDMTTRDYERRALLRRIRDMHTR